MTPISDVSRNKRIFGTKWVSRAADGRLKRQNPYLLVGIIRMVLIVQSLLRRTSLVILEMAPLLRTNPTLHCQTVHKQLGKVSRYSS